ncbi:BolA family transcriptional regulator [Pseudomonas sp. C27(2019)]|uniref:BolA family protein n=1 Tax=Pseudomonas sp. C27(2019) TaxID=2604941 RepID=UPI001248F05E|nr:BolA family protein [Pseudomonas sp. C27(2019)]QEY58875.1 BolA family transcriptional regulator [Pseudomonas sp. C27(2019)]
MMLQKIETALAALQPQELQIADESHMHSRGPESHFKVVVVSSAFDGVRKVQRHQKVYGVLGGLMQQFHGLALHAYSPEEWQAEQNAPDSPPCAGGSVRNQ